MYFCPQCLSHIDTEDGHNCEFRYFATNLAEVSQTWVTMLGDTSHGKTTLLESILEVLRRLQTRLPSFAINGIDSASQGRLQASLNLRNLPPANLSLPKPVLMEIFNFPSINRDQNRRRFVYFYDTPGEYLNSQVQMPLPELDSELELSASPWLIYELAMPDQFAQRAPLGELLSNLILRFRQANLKIAERTLIVTYTKTQQLLERFPAEVEAYLNSDPFSTLNGSNPNSNVPFNFHAYMQEAQKISDILESLTRQYPHGGNLLLELAKQNGIKLKFCLTESIGHSVADGTFHDVRSPKRVLDPLFWSIYLEQIGDVEIGGTDKKRKVSVLIDPDLKPSSPWFSSDWLTTLWKNLSKQVDVDFYFMGRQQPEVLAPSSPPTKPPAVPYIPLLAPVIKDTVAEQVILIVADKLPKDLNDFVYSDVSRNLVLLVSDEAHRDIWHNTLLIRSADDLASVRQLLIR